MAGEADEFLFCVPSFFGESQVTQHRCTRNLVANLEDPENNDVFLSLKLGS